MDNTCARIVTALEEKKARDIVVLDVKEMCSFTDYLIICTGTSDRQIKAVAENVIEKVGKPFGVEGIELGRWVLLDCVDVVVHIFQEDLRDYYDIEGMWMDAKRLVG
ncbi:MAG: ribosome silencing factor [Thermodesulfobacteriota bacterium]|nr:ribosome silencing factor [Thermodesulfobacteriota bacterium]